MDKEKYDELKTAGIISDGMIPKLDLGFKALEHSVSQVTIKQVQDLNIEQTGTQLIL